MAQTKTTTISTKITNNNVLKPTSLSPSVTVEAVVVQDALVPDIRVTNPGVIIGTQVGTAVGNLY